MIVTQQNAVTLVGAGQATSAEITRCLAIGPTLVAADGGALHCQAAGQSPSAIIGDMDSLPADNQAAAQNTLHPIAEQDSTDFDKALRNIDAPLILGVGFTGARLDHQLACFNALTRHPNKRCILLSDTDIAFLAPAQMSLGLPAGTRVSLFPMGLVSGTSEGLKWPINGLTFTPDGQIGTSNEATGAIELMVTAPKMLVILPKDMLELVAKVLHLPRGEWRAL